ncbi:MAG TPA: hypothetical protein VJ997_05320, partial [Longimicrobiales bacterium]|nr:hypothetical protein [Longimicrobiales bacterium]
MTATSAHAGDTMKGLAGHGAAVRPAALCLCLGLGLAALGAAPGGVAAQSGDVTVAVAIVVHPATQVDNLTFQELKA